MARFVVINESGRALRLVDDRIKSAVCMLAVRMASKRLSTLLGSSTA
jgi:hypothetical protein